MPSSDTYWQQNASIFANFYQPQLNPFYFLVHLFVKQRFNQIHKIFDIHSGAKLADIGCGNGLFLALALSHGAQVIGIDYSQLMLNLAKTNLAKYKKSQLKLINSDAHHLPIKNLTQDWVLAIGLLDYVEDLDKVMSEIQRILKVKGKAILTIPKSPSPIGFSRLGILQPLRRLFLGLPPLTNVCTHQQLQIHLNQNGFQVKSISTIQNTMWLVLVQKK